MLFQQPARGACPEYATVFAAEKSKSQCKRLCALLKLLI
jgi:hypothetical protein